MQENVVGHGRGEGGREVQHQHAILQREILVRRVQPERAGDLDLHILEIDRLGDDPRETDLLGAGLIFGRRLDAQAEDRHRLGFGAGAQHLEQREGAVLLQRKADQHGVGNPATAPIHRQTGRTDPIDFPRRVFESRHDLFDDGRLVVHQEDAQRIIITLGLVRRLALGLEIDDAADALDDHVFLERLHQVIAHALLGDLEHVLPARLGGEHDHRDGLQLRVGLELGEHLVAIHERHGVIEDDQVRAFARGHGQTLDAVLGLVHVDVEFLEGAGDDHTDRLAVIYGQDLASHTWCRCKGLVRLGFPVAT